MNDRMKKPKSIMAFVIITVMVLTTMIPLQAFAALKLSDVAGNWAEKEITVWVDQGLIKGYPDGTFKPNNNITRAEFIALVNRVFKFTETAPVTFKGVKETDWFNEDVAKAEKAGYLNELKDGTFILRENIKRQEVAAIIYMLESLTKDEKESEKFADADQIPASFKGFIGAVKKAGYMKGYPDGKFDPEKNLTRAEAVVSLNNLLGVKIDSIPEQTAYIGSYSLVSIKTDPAGAAISAQSSDETILTVEITGQNVRIKGIKEGSATVTVTAKKENTYDGTATFNVKVVKVPVSTSGGTSTGGGGSTPTNKAPVITVVEPDGVNDKVITLTQGSAFVAPSVTANDPEDGDITNKIVKTGEDKVDTFKVGEYILTYNVKDSKGLAAAEIKVTVKVVAAALSAVGNVSISDLGIHKVARVTLNSATIGSSFRSVDTKKVAKIGDYLQIMIEGKTKADFELLNAAGIVVGKFTVNLVDGNFVVTVTEVEAPKKAVNGEVKMFTLGNQEVARVIVSSSSEGSSFRSVDTQEVAVIGDYLQVIVNGKTKIDFELLDSAGLVIGTFSVEVAEGNFQAAINEVAAPALVVEGKTQVIVIGKTDIARVTFTKATAGASIKSVDSKETCLVGEHLQLVLEGQTKAIFELLDASGKVLGSFEIELKDGTFTADVN